MLFLLIFRVPHEIAERRNLPAHLFPYSSHYGCNFTDVAPVQFGEEGNTQVSSLVESEKIWNLLKVHT